MGRSFPGGVATDNVKFGNYASINNLSAYSVVYQLWLNTIDATSRRTIDKIGAATPGSNLFDHVVLTGSFRVRDYLWNNTGGIWTCTPPSTGVWHTVVVTYDGSNVANVPVIEFDGVGQTVTTSTAPVGTRGSESTDLYVGNAVTVDRCLDGKVAECAIWNRILSAAEKAALAVGNAPSFYPSGLVFYPDLGGIYSPEPNKPTVRDGTNGVVTGTTVVPAPGYMHYPAAVPSPKQTFHLLLAS